MRIFYLILMFLFGFSFMVSMLYSIYDLLHNYSNKSILVSIFALFDLILVYVFCILAG